jgi:hypothetical protein
LQYAPSSCARAPRAPTAPPRTITKTTPSSALPRATTTAPALSSSDLIPVRRARPSCQLRRHARRGPAGAQGRRAPKGSFCDRKRSGDFHLQPDSTRSAIATAYDKNRTGHPEPLRPGSA